VSIVQLTCKISKFIESVDQINFSRSIFGRSEVGKAALHAAQGQNGITGLISIRLKICYLKYSLTYEMTYMFIGMIIIRRRGSHQAGCTRMNQLTRNPTVSFIGKILTDCNMYVTLSFFLREYIRNYKWRQFGS